MRPSFWHERWRDGRIGFHRDEPNPALTKWWNHIDTTPKGAVLVPLCGKSLDMHWLAENGHLVTGVDLSSVAIDCFWEEAQLVPARSRVGSYPQTNSAKISLIECSFFNLDATKIPPIGAFYDRASIIALPAELRLHYASALERMVPSGVSGLMITVEYNQTELQGPPFSVPPDEVKELLSGGFEIEVLASNDAFDRASHLAERGLSSLKEHILRLTRR